MLIFCRLPVWIALYSAIGLAAPDSSHCPAADAQPILSIQAFRQLSTDDANRCLPVHLTAVVTYWAADVGLYFVQDGNYGVFLLGDLNPEIQKMHLHLGDRIDIEGATSGGDFSSDLWPMHVHVISSGLPPQPIRASGEDLLRNRYDCLRVSFGGRMLSADSGNARGTSLFLDVDGHPVQVIVQHWTGAKVAELIGTKVRVTGIDAAIFSPNGVYAGPQVFVAERADIKTEDAPTADPFTIPVTPISEVLRNPSGRGIDILVHVRGVVTGNSHASFYLEEKGHAVLVQSEQPNLPRAGDLVDAVGHPVFAGFGVDLEHGLFRTTGMTRIPQARPTSAAVILGQGQEKRSIDQSPIEEGKARVGEAYSDRLVSLNGELVSMVSYQERSSYGQPVMATDLVLRDGAFTFPAHLETADRRHAPPQFEPGTHLRLVGICHIAQPPSYSSDPRGFEMILRDASDIQVLQRPSWWTSRRLLAALGAALLVTLGALLWISMLRRRMREQTRDLRAAKEAAESASNAKSEFLANMSHEIRTPLNGVIGMVSVVLDGEIGEENRSDLEIVAHSAESLLTIMNDILDLSKIEAGKIRITPAPFDLRRLLTQSVELFAAKAGERNIPLRLEYDRDLESEFVGDEFRIRQIVLNLLGNAVKFTHQGEIAILASRGKLGLVRVTVVDTGIGIRPEDYEKLFQKFTQADASTTRRYGGTGLGLAISQSLAELMGGSIGFASEHGKGSEFWLEIPLPVVRSRDEETVLRA